MEHVTFHPSHTMLSLQPGSNMSRDKFHDTSLQSEWSIIGGGTYLIDDPTATFGLVLPETI
jgi:hypothetical protein